MMFNVHHSRFASSPAKAEVEQKRGSVRADSARSETMGPEGTPSLHHKICVPTGPTLGKSYSITCLAERGARATQSLDKIVCSELL